MNEIKVSKEVSLIPIEMVHANDIFRAIDSQRVYLGKWLPFIEYTRKREDTENYIRSLLEVPPDEFEPVYTIYRKKKFVGLIGFKDTDKLNGKSEIGYWLGERFQGKGIMTKSLECLLAFAFNELGLNRVQVKCAKGNEKSVNIPLRLGFVFEGTERQGELLSSGEYVDLNIYSKLKSEFSNG